MSAAMHTPGPWGVVGMSGFTLVGAGHNATAKREGWVAQLNDDQLGCEANAALIAAAPELYEALADLVCYHDVPGPVDAPLAPLLRAAFAALAKARGERTIHDLRDEMRAKARGDDA